ncbi:unnamed protein product, partial [Iphiclides podalirius]
MLLLFSIVTILWTVLLTTAIALPVDEFKKFTHEEGSVFDDEKFLMKIVPGISHSSHKFNKNDEIRLSDIVDEENEYYKEFISYIENGFTLKGLTFCIYDDNLRNAAIALFRLLQSIDDIDQLHKILGWATENINKDLLISSTLKDWSEEQARIKSIDIAIRECISRRVIFMDNGTKISMTEDNYIDLLAKILRANLDGIKSAKFIRSFFGYGGNNYPTNSYNPAPSLLHHPETSLRDPIYC